MSTRTWLASGVEEEGRARSRWLLLGAAVVVVAIVMAVAPTRPDRRAEAWLTCRQAVADRLRAPDQARFVDDSAELAVHLGEGRYRVQGYVDAVGLGGGRVRSFFSCTLEALDDGAWVVEDLTELGRAME